MKHIWIAYWILIALLTILSVAAVEPARPVPLGTAPVEYVQ